LYKKTKKRKTSISTLEQKRVLIVVRVLIGQSFHLANQMRFQRGPDSSVSIGQKTTNRTRWKVISF
jgi:hypothetical protein